ncbi:UNVERIFIED_CONTAM: hypothetical protein Sradi_5237600 [Sesamum radiatum]|uniref:Reverse transcriptase RNase H-like domain-containing protein n=1 Tax=Sesamum radiatum TaxID=300843 RepID=A0AAW2LNJ6_SESRA
MGRRTERVRHLLLTSTTIKAQALADFVSEVAGAPPDETSRNEKWLLHVDGSSTIQRSGASILITSPEGEDLEFAIKFGFKASNNEAEYEAFSSRMAHEGRKCQGRLLSRLASASEDCCTRHITIQYLPNPRAALTVQAVSSSADWKTPIVEWIEKGNLPDKRWDASRLKARAVRFLIQGGILYKKSYTHPLLRCMSHPEGVHLLKEIHSEYCGSHIGTWRTTPRGLTDESPFALVYGTEAIIPAELGVPSHRIMHFSENHNNELLKENLDLLEELREIAFIRVQRYKTIMINAYNRRVKAQRFQVGDLVLRRVDALKPVGKLDPT